MELPKFEYNVKLYNHIRTMKQDRKEYMIYNMELLGEGAAGTTYTAYVKPAGEFPDQVVLKEQKRTRFCINEFEALKFLREKMMKNELVGYYIFLYGSFTSGSRKYMILEKLDKGLDEYLTENNVDVKTYLQIFWHIANAVDYLEQFRFNHGDLWIENVMLKWWPGQNGKFNIKIIDYDSAFKENSQINHPSFGGADDFRDKFIRAEVVAYDKLIEAGSYASAREKGWVRTEGKEYVVQDGDVIEFRI